MSPTRPQTALGFLTVRNNEESGLIGGYLLLNEVGRPLEFHCTAPVKPNRAQQILFGPTLEPFLYGEQIGQTLLLKGSVEPLAVYTDVEAALSVRDFVSTPVALVLGARILPLRSRRFWSRSPLAARRRSCGGSTVRTAARWRRLRWGVIALQFLSGIVAIRTKSSSG